MSSLILISTDIAKLKPTFASDVLASFVLLNDHFTVTALPVS